MPANTISFEGVHRFLRTLFAGDLHAKCAGRRIRHLRPVQIAT
jgi:hypothetical protein